MKYKIHTLLFSMVLLCAFFNGLNAQDIAADLASHIDITVAQDGSGDYTKVQDAIDAAPSNSDETTVIFIKNGSYYEKIIIPESKPNLTLVGEHVDKTILWYDDRSLNQEDLNTFTSHSIRVDANDVKLMNLTIENPATESQAVALHGNGDRQTFAHCRVLGWQDTYYSDMRSRNYFKDCFIEGRTDYIFGFGVALFDSCQIHTINSGGVVTAASTPENYEYGFVFTNSAFTTPIGVTNFTLGRPWFDYAKTVLANCYEQETLEDDGWREWGGRESTCYYAEYDCFGPGADISGRVPFGQQLSAQEGAQYTIENVFSAANFNNLEDVGSAEDYYTTGEGQAAIAEKSLTYNDMVTKVPELSELGSGDADIIKYFYRWVGHTNEPYLDEIVWRPDGEWPARPAEDWTPDVDSDPVYQIVKSHFKMFLDPANTELGEFELLVGGESIVGFDTSKTVYGVELAAGATEPAEISVSGDAFVDIEYPESLPGYTDVTVTPYNQVGGKLFQVFNSLDSAFWNTDLSSLTINNEEVYESGVYEYESIVEDGRQAPYTTRWRLAIPEAGSSVEFATTVPGTTLITVTAIDGETTTEYKVHYRYALSITEDLNDEYVIMTNPVSDQINFKFVNALKTDVSVVIYSLNGQKMMDQSFTQSDLANGELSFPVDQLDSGMYLTVLEHNGVKIGKRLIKK